MDHKCGCIITHKMRVGKDVEKTTIKLSVRPFLSPADHQLRAVECANVITAWYMTKLGCNMGTKAL